MESIGAILQNERDKRGISLAEAHEATKITTQNLTWLEEDRFDAFPNRVYARAFLRDYANFLRLDSAELLERYESEWGPKSQMEPARKRRRFPLAAAVVLLVVLLAALAAGAYYFGKHGKPTRSASTPQEKADKPAPKPKPKPQPAKPETPTAAVPAVPAPVEELKLQMTGTTGSWVRVKVDDQPSTEMTIQPGQIQSFTAKNKFTVRLGRPNGVELHMNGQRLPMLGDPGIAVTKDIDRSWLKPASAPGTAAHGSATPSDPAQPAQPADPNGAAETQPSGGNPQ